jgi:glycosyltransferase involved in cell wall biosynthesis
VARPVVAIVSFRLRGSDGVSVEADKWAWALEQLGYAVVTVAGAGPVDRLLPGLAMGATDPPSAAELDAALADADVVVVENLCSLPLNPGAWARVAAVLAGRRALLHHHDLPWQRPQFAANTAPPDDPAWSHVTTSDLSRRELAERGIAATTIHNAFATDAAPGDGAVARAAIGVGPDEVLVVQPTRAIPRKNVPEGLALAAAVGATFWLLGPAEDGYGPDLEKALADAAAPVVRGHGPHGPLAMADVYAACDAVALPSTWEGFGNPAIESAVHRRPLAVGRYPVAGELADSGFRWFPSADPTALRAFLDAPDPALLEHNHAVADRHFSLRALPDRIAAVLAAEGRDGR